MPGADDRSVSVSGYEPSPGWPMLEVQRCLLADWKMEPGHGDKMPGNEPTHSPCPPGRWPTRVWRWRGSRSARRSSSTASAASCSPAWSPSRKVPLQDAAYDEDLLFAACVLHDLALGRLGEGKARFEVEGADLAVPVLTEHGVPAADVERVWEAITLHSIVGVADRLGLLTYLTHKGILIDAGSFTDLDAERLRQVYATEKLIKQVQAAAWTRPVRPS